MATLLTADEFLSVPPDDRVRQELVRGEVRRVSPAGGAHGRVGANLYDALMPLVRARRLGTCFFDGTGFLLPLPPALRRQGPDGGPRDTVRSPDVAFVRRDRVPAGGFGPGWVPLAPDLAVEVLSPSETASDVAEKLADYRAAGTELLWVVDPARRVVAVYAADAPTRWLREGDALDGGAVVPGFALGVDALFEDVAA